MMHLVYTVHFQKQLSSNFDHQDERDQTALNITSNAYRPQLNGDVLRGSH